MKWFGYVICLSILIFILQVDCMSGEITWKKVFQIFDNDL